LRGETLYGGLYSALLTGVKTTLGSGFAEGNEQLTLAQACPSTPGNFIFLTNLDIRLIGGRGRNNGVRRFRRTEAH
jgi:hypothetical protein